MSVLPNSKLDALVHYICARCDNPSQLGATKLNKVLWYSDVLAYAQHGESITTATYVKRQFGPVPKEIMASRARLKAAGAMIERQAPYHAYHQTQFVALNAPNISMFSADQISLVDTVMQAICSGFTAVSISAASHDLIWEAAEIGEEIPMAAAAFAGNIGEVDETDIAWAVEEIENMEREHALEM